MAVVSIGLPIFKGTEDNDLFIFIDLYRGYLNGIGIDPLDNVGGPPSGCERAMGILRSCMQGQAADWYDRYITGKNWKTNNIFAIIANGNIAAMRALALNALAANSLRLGSDAANYAVANGALLVSNTIWPGRELIGVDDM